MSETIIGVIAIVAASFISSFYHKAFKKKGSKNHQFIQRAKKKGCFTEGKAVSSRIRTGIRGHSDPYMREKAEIVKYAYVVNGITFYKQMAFQSPGMMTVSYPDKVTVYYDSSNPAKAVCPEEATKAQQRESGIIGTIAVFIATLFVVINALKILLG